MRRECLRLWGQVVLGRDGRICQRCGRPGNNPHHIFSKAYLSVILDLDNGICLCWACHKHYAHERFEEFRDLVIAKRGETAYMRLKFVALNGSPMDFELCKMVLETLLKNGKELRDGTHN